MKFSYFSLVLVLMLLGTSYSFGQTTSQCTSGENNLLINGSFEETSNSQYDSAYELIENIGRDNSGVKFIDRHPDSDFPGWFTTGGIFNPDSGVTSTGGTLELGQTGFLGVEAPDGLVFAEMDGNHHDQIITVTPGQLLDWELKHRGRNGTDVINISAGPVGNTSVIKTVSSPNTAWITHKGQYQVPNGISQIQFRITPFGASDDDLDSSHLLDDVKVCPISSTTNLCNEDNIALGKATRQSSTYANNNSKFGAANAVDGNRNGNHNNNSISHTKNTLRPWWEIDLGSVHDLSSVKIWNRTNCCANRLTNFHVLVTDVPFNSTGLNNAISQSGVGDFHFPGTAGRETDINLNRTGRYLRIQLAGTNALQLAEVEIMGCPTATIYKHCGYNGTSATLGIGEYPNISSVGLLNDDISSLRVPAGLQVTLFEHYNFGGSSITFTSDDNCLINNSFNDKTSSFKIKAVNNNRRTFSSRLTLTPSFGQKTNLEWHVSQREDKEIKHYRILHSTDEMEEMSTLATIESTGVAGIEPYLYLHQTPAAGKNFYQVLIEYEDGSVDYSMYDEIVFEEVSSPITIAPNPARNTVKIDFVHYMNKSVKYSLLSLQGVKMLEGNYESDHDYIEELNIESIPNGVYILHLIPENSRAVAVKIVVNKDS